MSKKAIIASLLYLSTASAGAQEVAVGGSNNQNSGVISQIQSLKSGQNIIQNEIAKQLACADVNAIYAPGHTDKDANDCVEVTLKSESDLLEARVTALEAENSKIAACGNNNKVYAPANPGRDVNGCISSGIPAGTVAAFTAACPSGWSTFTSANERFLVGAGSGYSLGDTGGANTVTLNVNEMPNHSHAITGKRNDNSKDRNPHYIIIDDDWHSSRTHTAQKTRNTGGNQAHENRPPYLAVNWCRKN